MTLEPPAGLDPEKGNNPRETAVCFLLLALAVFGAWSNSFRAPFVYDDYPNIVTAESIRRLSPLRDVLFPTEGMLDRARPLFNLSLAVNHAVSGLSTWSYHLVNVLAQVLAAWALFAMARLTFGLSSMRERFGGRAGVLSLFLSLFWALHPVNTEAVTYISERSETLMVLFFFLSAWLAARGWASARPARWHALSVLAFVAGAGSKETIAVLPLLMLAYEWVFLSRGPVRAVRRSALLYGGYALGLLLLGFLVAAKNPGSTGPTSAISPISYLATQSRVIFHYLGVVAWPPKLCFYYDWPVLAPGRALPYLAALAALFCLSAWLLYKKRPAGFLGIWFFLALAPTSSFLPLEFTARDRRMILPLAALAALVVAAAWRAGQWFLERFGKNPGARRALAAAGLALGASVALALGLATWDRNLDYATPVSIWRDTVEKAPGNFRAWEALGQALEGTGEYEKAVEAARKALALAPDRGPSWVLLGTAFWDMERAGEAEAAFRRALAHDPDNFLAHGNLSTVYFTLGRHEEAIREARLALAMRPDYFPARMNLALSLAQTGHLDEAEREMYGLARTDPRSEALYGMGRVLEMAGRQGEAEGWYARALRENPQNQEARIGLAGVLYRQGRLREAAGLYQEVLERFPCRVEVLVNLGQVLVLLNQPGEARKRFQKALDLEPGNPGAQRGLAGLGDLKG